ncbi:hypothetical protein LUW75_14255 [Streptomyces sp. MRC013]|uniref:hypothetical protein n=1 Tax=Streptomyces sp. MRC013 TaxID=2898276 RepID=UPI00202714B2|nr:hypothetical protein [Streptomyces sp. MRC013]URM90956.1 hypothetical protein LUW75_14255 [Streptomyces sp. MRC013]
MGRELHRRAAETQRAGRVRVHGGVSDEEYLTALKVLQRMIVNAGGDLPRGA